MYYITKNTRNNTPGKLHTAKPIDIVRFLSQNGNKGFKSPIVDISNDRYLFSVSAHNGRLVASNHNFRLSRYIV